MQHAGNTEDAHGDGRGERIDVYAVHAHQGRRCRIVGSRAECPADGRGTEQPLQAESDHDGGHENEQWQRSCRQSVGDRDACCFEAAARDGARIGGENFQQQILHHDRKPERHHQ